MQEQAIPGYKPCEEKEAELKQIDIKGLFKAYLSSEYFSDHYKLSSQLIYSQDIRRFLKLFNFTGQFDADKLPELIQQYAKLSSSASNRRSTAALKSAASWGMMEGLLSQDLDINFQPLTNKTRSLFIDFNINPLSSDDLVKLMQAASKKPRDKALILTVLVTRTYIDKVRELTTDNIAQD